MTEYIIQPRQKIEELLGKIRKEVEAMPDRDIFGDSNAEAKAKSRQWIRELKSAFEGKLVVDRNSEVYLWLTGSGYAHLGRDYGVE